MNITRIEPLTRHNYDSWRIQAEALSIKNDGWLYVSGECKKPEAQAAEVELTTAQLEWIHKDQKARSDLILSISPSELQHVKSCTTAREVWLKLEEVYASKGPARKATLLKRLIIHKMKESDDIREHIMKFFNTVDKLAAMSVDIHKDLLAVMLLYSLPPSFENFRCAMES